MVCIIQTKFNIWTKIVLPSPLATQGGEFEIEFNKSFAVCFTGSQELNEMGLSPGYIHMSQKGRQT